MAEPVLSRKTYLMNWIALLALTLLTILLATFKWVPGIWSSPAPSLPVQASLIAGFFMHALYESALVRVVTARRNLVPHHGDADPH